MTVNKQCNFKQYTDIKNSNVETHGIWKGTLELHLELWSEMLLLSSTIWHRLLIILWEKCQSTLDRVMPELSKITDSELHRFAILFMMNGPHVRGNACYLF